MGFKTLAFVYALGGVTFLPLLALLVILPAWFWLPKTDGLGTRSDGEGGSDALATSLEEDAADALHHEKDGREPEERGASGVFAVLRTYDFALASTALTSRSSGSGNVGGSGNTNDPNDNGELPAQSDSVYQAMYRSVFDRSNKNKDVNALRSEGDDGNPNDGGSRSRGKLNASRHLFYIVLRHGHLMLYSSSAQVEVKHVISLAHHTVSLSEGDESAPGQHTDQEPMQESDLFVKRSAILLTPTNSPHIRRVSSPRPFYLFIANCSDKEDFYHSLLAAQSQPPKPLSLQPEHLIKLQTNLHATTLSTSLTPETRALDAVLGRLFLALYRTDFICNHIKTKIERKIARVQKPAFIESVVCESVDLGDSAPVLSNLRLRDLNISGDMVISADVRYTGNFKLTLAALAKIDLGLGQRFKPRTMPLLLAGILKKLQGHVLVRIKPPPSNRLWVCFEQAPEMEVKIEPVVGVRQISYGFILRAIEGKIREVVAETLVKPNWDDVPFFDSSNLELRGGLWQQDRKDENLNGIGDTVAGTTDPALSTATIPTTTTSSAASSSIDLQSPAASVMSAPISAAQQASNISLKRRSVASLPVEQLSRSPPKDTSPRPIRSPSFAASAASPSAPSVALDDFSAESVRGDDMPAQSKRWRTWAASGAAVQARKDAKEAIRDLKDRTMKQNGDSTISDAQQNASPEELRQEDERAGSPEEGPTIKPFGIDPPPRKGSDGQGSRPVSTLSTTSRSQSIDADTGSSLDDVDFQTLWQSGRMTTDNSSSSQNPSAKSAPSGPRSNANPRAKALLAATTAATSAAKAWYANRKSPQPNTPLNSPQPQANVNPSSSSLSISTDTSIGGSPASIPARGTQQRRTSSVSGQSIQDGPYGRGQPLPPPGTPLPGPEKERSGWSLNGMGGAAAGLIGGAGGRSLKRKPVLPARRPVATTTPSASSERGAVDVGALDVPPEKQDAGGTSRVSGEFGPWAENAGLEDAGSSADDLTPHVSAEVAATEDASGVAPLGQSEPGNTTVNQPKPSTDSSEKKIPPPLPVRPPNAIHRAWDNSPVQASRRTSTTESARRSSRSLRSETARDLHARVEDAGSDEVLNIPAPLIGAADEAASARES
ncbi:hypothetical protein K431DRAFT_281602 [Polychaeton citri CBS 116435]|uniref:SMP-LTD domain-containing protein n=1 Tax=Polychaeton citri CBS 116435 TaxID=1314669 RepID=A0A9P4QGV2_9PEZI|nr:hypothetical protein K431DRAFT_281602 [Polychaeton citri CBS 116435]